MKAVTIIGARPQFIKASAVSSLLRKHHTEVLVHTGQHYDANMSDVFFEELGVPSPDYHLNIGSGPHGAQTGAMMREIEVVLMKERPDLVLVYGDTNSTLAGAIAASKLRIDVAHVEAGLRSFNRNMPEEINRVVTDHVSSLHFVPSETAKEQLAREGVSHGVYVVGDVMLDVVRRVSNMDTTSSTVFARMELTPGEYCLCTVHRAENTDDPLKLSSIFEGLEASGKKVLVPLHPRTEKKMKEFKIRPAGNVRLVGPVGYLDMVRLQKHARCVLTDSGGVQKEAYYLGVPCVTLRNETEWVETVAAGWNILAGTKPSAIVRALREHETPPQHRPDLYGNGTAGKTIVDILTSQLRTACVA